jgi:hypothetical protein
VYPRDREATLDAFLEEYPSVTRERAVAFLEFGDDLRGASAAASRWARANGLTPDPPP